MAPQFKRIVIVLLLFIVSTYADDPPFPHIKDFMVEFYQTEVQVTNEEQQATAFATEYFDSTQGRGSMNLLIMGLRQSVYYYNETNEILEVNATNCQTWDIDESIYYYQSTFYGWLNKDPLVIGPSAALWFAENYKDKIEYNGQTKVRDIKVDKYSLPVIDDRDNVTMYYYFAVKEWTTPYKYENLRVPIRIEAKGVSSKDTASKDQWLVINQITDFAYFSPTISNWLAFQPPVGTGCPLRKSTKSMPEMPKIFRYSAEVFDVVKAKDTEINDIEYQQVWYDSVNKLGRHDKYTRMMFTSELYDFNTGVTYSVANFQTCTIKPLRKSMFEGHEGKLVGHLKEPGEVLKLDGSFYYMGERYIRGIKVDSFESIQKDVVFMDKTLVKLVITVYFTQEFMEIAVNGEEESKIPVYYAVKGWDTPTNVAINLQYNIFEFDDVIYPDMYTTFRLGRCFPSMQDKAYIIMIIDALPKLGALMEKQDDFVIEELRNQIVKHAKISNMRIPLLRADYKSSGVFVTGLILDRPPALKQFWFETEGEVTEDAFNLKPVADADTKEKCAYACVGESDFICKGFYFCNEACFLKSKDLLDPSDNDEKKGALGRTCQTYIRAEIDSNNYEAYLKDALKNLEDAVTNQTVKIILPIDKDSTEDVYVQDIIIGDGPYTGGNNQEKPYDIVINFSKLKKSETTLELHEVDTLNDCYKACKTSDAISCSSFSYCPRSDNKQCVISSLLVVDKVKNAGDTVDDANCYVYSLKYLDFYDPYPGRTVLISGEDVQSNINSTEMCAKICRDETKFACRGFEYCRTARTCVLHSKHILDLKPGETAATSKKSTCVHYAARFSADYYDMGFSLLDDDSDKRTELTLEDCARICSEELKSTCKSFNYCPASNIGTDSSCSLSSKMLTDKSVTTTSMADKNCHHYEKKSAVDDWAKADKKLVTSGYTKSGFAGLVVGMLALGLLVGIVAFLLYSYYRSRSAGDGLSVRFTKQENS
ncbi:hypothetical protein X975_08079, partial [Stegodyphus mimosarum]